MLKKEFKEKDVKRIRNLVQKKYGDKTSVSVGYDKTHEERAEGDVWEEDGRKWTIRNGIKQNITKLDKFKKEVVIPFLCPNCSKSMGSLDRAVYPTNKKCADCVSREETLMRARGTFEEYVRATELRNRIAFATDYKQYINDYLNNQSKGFITEQGELEKWVGGNVDREKILAEMDEYIEQLKSSVED